MDQVGQYLINLLAQFGGGPGPPENNLARFGLAAVFWTVLLLFAWSRQRRQNRPREKWLLIGFGLALFRELFMFAHVSMRLVTGSQHGPWCAVVEPLEHALTLAAVVVIGGSFLRYILDDAGLARNYLRIGLGATTLGCAAVLVWWPGQLAANPDTRFHATWQAVVLHLMAAALIASALLILARKKGWLRNVVLGALSLFFLSEISVLVNLLTDHQFSSIICPIGNNLYVWAIPLFGFVYFQEQAREKTKAEEALQAYRYHLEELVRVRTAALTEANKQLQLEVQERRIAEVKIAQRNSELAAQNAITAAISQSLDLEMILRATLESAVTLLGMTCGCIFLVDPNDGRLALQMHQGCTAFARGEQEGVQCRLCREIAQQAAADMRPVVMATGEKLVLDPSMVGAEESQRTLVGTPLVTQGRIVGVLTLGASRSAVIAPEELDLLTAVGQQVGIAVENARLYQETQQWADGMARLHSLSQSLNSTLYPAEIYDQITQQSARLMECQVSIFFCWDEETQEARAVSGHGPDEMVDVGSLSLDGQPILPEFTESRHLVVLENAATNPLIPLSWRKRFHPQVLLRLPLWSKDRPIGYLILMQGDRTPSWSRDKLELLQSFADRAVIALENAQLHARVEQAAALEERQRIAAEMHDGLAQTLSYLSLKTDHAAEMLQQGKGREVLEEFRQMRAAIDETSRDIRRSIAMLQHGRPKHQSLQEALGQTASKVSEGGQTPVEIVSHLEAPLFLPPSELEQVVRVVREALWNAQRHAAAGHIVVYLDGQGDVVRLMVEDDGRGFETSKAADGEPDHFGLTIMHARAAHIHGELCVDSQPGRGTRVTLSWPTMARGATVASQGSQLADWQAPPVPVATEPRR